MNRRMSHALARRSTNTSARVTQTLPRRGNGSAAGATPACSAAVGRLRRGSQRFDRVARIGARSRRRSSRCARRRRAAWRAGRARAARWARASAGCSASDRARFSASRAADSTSEYNAPAWLIELRDEIVVVRAVEDVRVADHRVAAVAADLGREPLKILERVAAVRQHVHRAP